MILDMETARMLGESEESGEHWDAWRRVFSRARQDAEILEWCAGQVRDSIAGRGTPDCEGFRRFVEALGRLEALLGNWRVSNGIASLAERFPEEYERGQLDDGYEDESRELEEEEEEWL